jgi:hypothetical protein
VKPVYKWLAVNFILLAVYLSFFHLCIGAEAPQCITYGIVFSALSVVIISFSRKVFKNSYEYLFYHTLAIDIFIEGFISLHDGYSFYACAAAFWAVFILYHFNNSQNFKCLCGSKVD